MTRVIKIGGRAQLDEQLPVVIADAWDALSNPLVIVHGGGAEVSTLQTALGATSQFVGGRRVTTAQDLEIVRMALSGSANKRLVSSLVREGVRAVGISGEDASLIAATPIDQATLGFAGTPQKVNASLIRHLLDGGYVPVISPVSRDVSAGHAGNGALNVNADDAAAAIASALDATELLLVSDVPGVLVDDAPVQRLTMAEARAMVADGTAAGGMAAKLEAAIAAMENGVARVRIGDLAIVSNVDGGTAVLRAGE